MIIEKLDLTNVVEISNEQDDKAKGRPGQTINLDKRNFVMITLAFHQASHQRLSRCNIRSKKGPGMSLCSGPVHKKDLVSQQKMKNRTPW
jgi:hypothetical protein